MKKLAGTDKLEKHMVMRMSMKTAARLETLSKKYNITKSEIIRQLIDNYCDEENNDNILRRIDEEIL